MAQNEMKAKPAVPERVRSMEGLEGGSLPAKHYEEGERCHTNEKAPRLQACEKADSKHAVADWGEQECSQFIDIILSAHTHAPKA